MFYCKNNIWEKRKIVDNVFRTFFVCILLFLFASLHGTSKEKPYYNTSFTVLHKKGNKKGKQKGVKKVYYIVNTLHTHHKNTN